MCTIFLFSKATGLDGTFPPAWIGTGIAYAAQEEGDQAMAAFRTAARLFPGCVIHSLYFFLEDSKLMSTYYSWLCLEKSCLPLRTDFDTFIFYHWNFV